MSVIPVCFSVLCGSHFRLLSVLSLGFLLCGCQENQASLPTNAEQDILSFWDEEPDEVLPTEESLETLDNTTGEQFQELNLAGHQESKVVAAVRYPLLKQVRHTLTQTSTLGTQQKETLLETWLTLSQRESLADQNQFQIHFQRVRYQESGEGVQRIYDTAQADSTFPPQLKVYEQIVEKGFSFFMNQQHQITQLAGYEDFLSQVTTHLEPVDQEKILSSLQRLTPSEAVAHFIDESYGLSTQTSGNQTDIQLISHQTLKSRLLGESWQGTQTIRQPVEITFHNNYRLAQRKDSYTQVEVDGSVFSGSAPIIAEVGTIELQGGKVRGNYWIDEQTQLPIQTALEQQFQLKVTSPSGIPFDQLKVVSSQLSLREGPGDSTVGIPRSLPTLENQQTPLRDSRSHIQRYR